MLPETITNAVKPACLSGLVGEFGVGGGRCGNAVGSWDRCGNSWLTAGRWITGDVLAKAEATQYPVHLNKSWKQGYVLVQAYSIVYNMYAVPIGLNINWIPVPVVIYLSTWLCNYLPTDKKFHNTIECYHCITTARCRSWRHRLRISTDGQSSDNSNPNTK